MFFLYTVDSFINVYIFYSETKMRKWCGFVALKPAEDEQKLLWPVYGNQDDAKHTVADCSKKKKTDWRKQLTCKNDPTTSKNLLTLYFRLSRVTLGRELHG